MPANGDGQWGHLAHEAFDADDRRMRLADATAGMVAATVPLVVGLVIDLPHAGLVAALGGLNVAMSMAPGRPGDRAPWGVATLVAATALVGLATAAHPTVWLSVAVAFVIIGAASFLRVLGPQGALVGFVVSAVFVIGNGLAGSPADAPTRAAQFFAGGLVALGLMMLAGACDRPTPRTTERAGWSEIAAAARARGGVRRYAVVLGATVAATTLLYRAAGLDFGYWIPLTALAVLQPDAHASRVRLVQRASGTVLGCAVVALAVAGPVAAPLLIGAVALTSFGLFALRERSYHWLVVLLTPTALLMISTVDFQGDDIGLRRIVDTAIGLTVVMVVLAAVNRSGPGGLVSRRHRGGTAAGTAPVEGRPATARRR